MTCIIGLLSDGVAYIGGDSCGSNGWTEEDCAHSKVFRVGDFVIGGTTSFRMLDLLEYSLTIPEKRPWTDEDLEKFMRTAFVNAVRSCLKDGGFATKKSEAELGGTFLVGYKGHLWRVQNDYSIITRTKYDSVGCGQMVAFGSLFATETIGNLSAEHRVTAALLAAEEHVCGVRGPFNVLSTAVVANG